ncbi:hypothetical protein TSAR_003260, partial [Trichomalopsis sarcophagae]
VFDYEDHCADPHTSLIRSDDIPPYSPGNCLFHSIIKTHASSNNTTTPKSVDMSTREAMIIERGKNALLNRPPRKNPPWSIPEYEVPALFSKQKEVPEHPFRLNKNLIFLLITDIYLETEILDAMLERG